MAPFESSVDDPLPGALAALGHDWQRVDADGFIDLVGPFWSRMDGDRFCMAFHAADKHRNRRGVVQGGMIATLADRAMGQTSRQENGGKAQATIQLDIRYLDAAHIGDVIEARCKVDRKSRHVVFVSADIVGNGRMVAHAQGIWKVLDA